VLAAVDHGSVTGPGSGTLTVVERGPEVQLDGVVLTGARLTLRPWREADADRVHEILQDRRMHEFLALPQPYSHETAIGFVSRFAPTARAEGTALECAVDETATGRVVGSAKLRLGGDPEIGFWIAPDAQGRGYAAEATTLLAEWGFARGLRRVRLNCDVRNLASARTALAAGFRFAGVSRDGITSGGTDGVPPHRGDLARFARLPDDPPGRVAPAFAPLPPGGLTDGVVTLRLTEPADADGFFEQETDPVTVANGFTGRPPAREAVRHMANRAGLDWLVGSAGALTILDAASGGYAGSLRLRRSGPPGVGGIGYAVHPAFRGRGYTARALRLLAGWAFDGGGFARLELGAKVDNVASQRAALAAGFAREGVMRARLRAPDGAYRDEARFCLLSPSA
jgi:RimJ/RimL family protein N-acetyltransferase